MIAFTRSIPRYRFPCGTISELEANQGRCRCGTHGVPHMSGIRFYPRPVTSLEKSGCWRKNQHTRIRGQVFAESRKVNQACQSIWPEIDKGENKVKFESVSAGIPNISQMGISASFADTIDDKKDIKCKRVVKERIGRIILCTKWQNRLWTADRVCVTRSKLRMCNSDDVS